MGGTDGHHACNGCGPCVIRLIPQQAEPTPPDQCKHVADGAKSQGGPARGSGGAGWQEHQGEGAGGQGIAQGNRTQFPTLGIPI